MWREPTSAPKVSSRPRPEPSCSSSGTTPSLPSSNSRTTRCLLGDGKTTLVSRVTKPAWGDGQVIVVTNGSFLLNLPLVNHEHRKLAGHLIRECVPGTKVAFLESGPGGPPCRTPRANRPRRNPRVDASCWPRTGSCWVWCIASASTRFLADRSHSRMTPRRSSASTLRRSGNCWSEPRMNRSPGRQIEHLLPDQST